MTRTFHRGKHRQRRNRRQTKTLKKRLRSPKRVEWHMVPAEFEHRKNGRASRRRRALRYYGDGHAHG